MPSLSLSKWVRYEPSIPGNLELPAAERFYLEVHAGLTVEQFETMRAPGPDGETFEEARHRLATHLAGVVRLGAATLVLDGRPVEAVADYISAILCQSGQPLYQELLDKVRSCNSWEGTREVFSVRLSGSTASTPARSNGAGTQTAAQ